MYNCGLKPYVYRIELSMDMSLHGWSLHFCMQLEYQVGIYMFKVNNRNTRARCAICSELTIKTPERRHLAWDQVVMVSLLLTLNVFNTLF